MDFDVVVVGAGPTGCAVARDIGKEGYKVAVIEEHEKIGEPVQCAGLVSPRTLGLTGISGEIIIDQLKGAFVYSPKEKVLEIRGRRSYALAINRSEFDRQLGSQAREAGVEFLLSTRATGLEVTKEAVQLQIKQKNKFKILRSKLIIGADGVNSKVARWLDICASKEIIRMYAAEVKLKNNIIDDNNQMVHIFLGCNRAPGWFGWIIPLGGRRARVGIGIGSSVRRKSPYFYFKQLVSTFPRHFQGLEIIKSTGGIVPIGLHPKTFCTRAMLVGDAALHTKPISGGGVYLGLRGAGLCAQVALNALQEGDFSQALLSSYQTLWEKEMGREIKNGLRHREIFLNLSDQDMENLIEYLCKPYWQSVILKYGDIDYPSSLAEKLAFAAPWAEKFLLAGISLNKQGKVFKTKVAGGFFSAWKLLLKNDL